MDEAFTDLILRSRAQHGVSKDGPKRCGPWPSFETALRASSGRGPKWLIRSKHGLDSGCALTRAPE